MTSTANTDRDWVARSAAGAFAVSLSALLDLLSMGARGPVLATLLADAERLLESGDVELAVRDECLVANGEVTDTAGTQQLRMALTLHGVEAVHVDADASDRELLHFVALLSGSPTRDSFSFADLWQERGSWRISVRLRSTRPATASADADVNADANADANGSDIGEAHARRHAAQDAANMLVRLALGTGDVSPSELRAVAPLVGRGWHTDADSPLGGVLRRGGEEATMVLLDQLAQATTGAERRRYFDAIVSLGSGTAHLVSALRHPRWFVARNAAELLGDMGVRSADTALAECLGHVDTRVRLAAVRALGRLHTGRALSALVSATRDGDADVRGAAWRGLAAGNVAIPPAPIIAALRDEEDPAVQRRLIDCVKTSDSHDVVTAFVRFCTRIAVADRNVHLVLDAVSLLVLRRPVVAMPLLRRLENHQDSTVRARMTAIRAAITPLCESPRPQEAREPRHQQNG